MIAYGTFPVLVNQRHRIGEDGLGTYTCSVIRDTVLSSLPAIGSAPSACVPAADMLPGVTLYDLTDVEQSQAEDGSFQVDFTFKGIGQTGIVLVSLDGGTAEENIEHHPNFPTWAGTENAPKFSQAYWDLLEEGTDSNPNTKGDIYKFNGFKASADYNLGRVTSFITAAYTIQLTDLVANGYNLESQVEIGIPTVSGWTFSGSYLFESSSVEKLGAAYRRTRRYRRSGPTAWSSTIYPS